jgi:ATP-dependent DNA helicase RecQ
MVHGPGDVPQLRRFIDDSDADASQKRIEHGKLDALLSFTEAPGCRRQVLLAHLGETLAAPCGNCDRCLEPQVLEDRTVAAQKALSAVYRTGHRFGAAHLTDVLLGADTARVRALGHQTLSVYGIGTELDRDQWRALLRQLTAAGWLEPVPDGHGGLRWGDESRVRALLRGEVSLQLPDTPARRERQRTRERGRGERQPVALEGDADPQLLADLKAWRREQARQQGVPPYVVFHDRTLVELVVRRPLTLGELAQVSGIGQAKLERYGAAVLAVLQGQDPPA